MRTTEGHGVLRRPGNRRLRGCPWFSFCLRGEKALLPTAVPVVVSLPAARACIAANRAATARHPSHPIPLSCGIAIANSRNSTGRADRWRLASRRSGLRPCTHPSVLERRIGDCRRVEPAGGLPYSFDQRSPGPSPGSPDCRWGWLADRWAVANRYGFGIRIWMGSGLSVFSQPTF